MIRTTRPFLAVVAAAALAVAGCAGSSGNAASSTPVATSASVGSVGAAPSAESSSSTAPSSSDPSSSDPSSSDPSSSDLSSSVPSSSSAPSSSTASSGVELNGTVTVFAAASLQKTFDELTATFEKEHPGVDVQISYDGSSTLVTQLAQGAEADVFASADQKNMTKATDAGLIDGTPTVFATNTLQIAVKPGNPKGITDLAGLAKSGVATVVCAPEVPCGSAARTALKAAGVTLDPASEEQKVTDVLTKVAEGDADAGLVYKTDVAGSGGTVEGIDFKESAEAVNSYPVGVLKDAPNPAAAAAFVDVVTGAEGQKTLAAAGFGAP
ncbi:MAG: molybdate ABC transporter substrate-binding protein [Nakamurella sp.]